MTDQFASAGTDRTTPWSGYTLPPEPPRFSPKFNGNKQYLLANPVGGLPTGYSRATTVADTLDDTYNLNRWIVRTNVASVLRLVDVALGGKLIHYMQEERKANPDLKIAANMLADLLELVGDGNGPDTNKLIDEINNHNGGKDAAEFGTAVHAWLEALDLRMVQLWQIPEQFQPWAQAYVAALARAGLVAVPEYVERLVYNDAGDEVVVGTLDRIYRCVTTGELYLGDVKTSKADNLKYSWVTYAVQLNIYGRARLMISTDGKIWEPMPQINQRMALLVHVPSDAPDKCQVIPYNLDTGDTYKATSITARDHRRNAKYQVPGLTTPIPSKEALRWVKAYQALQNAHAVSDLDKVWEEFQDVWSDELTELGHAVAPLLSATATQ